MEAERGKSNSPLSEEPHKRDLLSLYRGGWAGEEEEELKVGKGNDIEMQREGGEEDDGKGKEAVEENGHLPANFEGGGGLKRGENKGKGSRAIRQRKMGFSRGKKSKFLDYFGLLLFLVLDSP